MRFAAPALVLLSIALPAQAATPVTGRWITGEGKAEVVIAPCGRGVCGHIARMLPAAKGAPSTDQRNPDPALRTRPLVGLPILNGVTDQGDDWRGTIYSPEEGKTYKTILRRNADGTLTVKGCIAFLCRTMLWKPAS